MFSHCTQQGSLWPAQGAPLQLSQTFSLPRKHFTNDTLDNRSSFESPATQGAGGLGKSLSTDKGRWQLGARDTASLWSLGMIDPCPYFLKKTFKQTKHLSCYHNSLQTMLLISSFISKIILFWRLKVILCLQMSVVLYSLQNRHFSHQ